MSDRDQKLKLLMALREKKKRLRQAPAIYYKPHPGQVRFHEGVRTHRITICHPGNRFGKSHANAAEIVAHLYGYRMWQVPGLKLGEDGDYPPRSEIPMEYWIKRADEVPLLLPCKHLCATGLPARQGILSTMFPKIEEFLPPAVRQHPNYRVQRGAMSVPLTMILPPELSTMGGVIQFASGEQDPMSYEGQSFTSASFDEPPKRNIWAPLWRGLTDQMARLWMTATPIGPNAPWVYEIFIQKSDELDVSIIAIAGSIHENPHITKRAKHEFLEGGGFTEEERQARESGAWSFLSHRAFPQFEEGIHIVPAETPIPSKAVIGVACDPAHRRPFAFIWGAWHNDELLIYDEWPKEDHAKMRTSPYVVKDYARIVREQEQGRHIDYRCLDPRFGVARPSIKGERHTTIKEDFEAAGLYWDCRMDGAEKEEIGIEKLRSMLRYDKKRPLDIFNRPKLRIRANCINTINALAYSSFMSNRDPDVLDEKMAAKYKDFRDTLRYLVIFPFVPGDNNGEDYSYISDEDLRDYNNDASGWF